MTMKMKKPIAFVLTLVMAFGMWTGLPAMMVGVEVGAPEEVHAAAGDVYEISSWADLDLIAATTPEAVTIPAVLTEDGVAYTTIYAITAGAVLEVNGILTASAVKVKFKAMDPSNLDLPTIKFTGEFTCFDVVSLGLLSLENVTVTNSFDDSSQKAAQLILVTGAGLVVKKSELGNTTNVINGIVSYGSNITMSGVTMSGLSNVKGTANANGACIVINDSTINASDIVFENCSAGAIAAGISSNLIFTETAIQNMYGKNGAVVTISSNSTLDMSSTTISGCVGSGNAGAISNQGLGEIVTLSSVTILNCENLSKGFGGGGVTSNFGQLFLTDVSITGCKGPDNSCGGGLYIPSNGTVSLGGKIEISGNKVNGKDNDVYIGSVTQSALIISGAGLTALASDSSIGVIKTDGTSANPITSVLLATGGGLTATEKAIFFANNTAAHTIKLSGDAIYMEGTATDDDDDDDDEDIGKKDNTLISGSTSTGSSNPAGRMTDVNVAAVGNTPAAKHWAYDAINFALKRHWMNGISNTEFAPDNKVSRAMVAQVFGNMSNFFANGYKDSPYSDVKIGAWYGPAVAWAESTGVMAGIGGGKFAPERNMTREELAVAFYNYAKSKNMNMTVTGNLSKFKDSNKVASWSKDALIWANANGIINGRPNGNLDPKSTATRAELASILYKFDELN